MEEIRKYLLDQYDKNGCHSPWSADMHFSPKAQKEACGKELADWMFVQANCLS